MSSPVVVVGAGQAAAALARELRTLGWEGGITLLGDEPHPPYERPPLSKAILDDGQRTLDWLLAPADLQRLGIEHRPGWRATRIDREGREVHGAGGERIPYSQLVLATGGRARRLGALDATDGTVHYLRTLEDAIGLHQALRPGSRLAVVGGGWIGLEVAAVARGKGLEVTVIEAASRVCERSLPTEASRFVEEMHRAQGVAVRLDARLSAASRTPGGAWRLGLDNGNAVEADHIVVGVGMVPNAELAADAGLALAAGAVQVDAQGRTSDPHIFAAGDVSCFRSRWSDRPVRLESWANAQSQAAAVARAIVGSPATPEDLPTFWSEQYGTLIQMAGLPGASASVVNRTVQPGKPVWLLCEGNRLTGVVAVGAPREFRSARKLIESGAPVDTARLADPAARLDGA